MKKELFINLIGKTRYEIGQVLGYGYNCFGNEVWIYEVGRTWIGRRIILSIKFTNGKASEISIFRCFKRR
ncbi:hypothetical protein AAEU33_16640 [Chryseobacterium sp. Chry.R1]|uniref:hypothetical protein n=1 Tax=Chryseobacterium sp. Chry.R1 TaxID=3139392 RepID=UPI0031F8E449